MSSQWVDTRGNQWRFSSASKTWQKLADGRWVTLPAPPGGLRRSGSHQNGDVVVVDRIVGATGARGASGPPGPPGSDLLVSEVLSGEYQDGVNATFPLSSSADLSQAFQVFRNGLMETPGHGYLVTPTHVTLTTPPLGDDVVTVVYQRAQ